MLISGPKISGRTRRNPISPKAPTAIILVRPSLSDNLPNKRAPAPRSTSTRSMAGAERGKTGVPLPPPNTGQKKEKIQTNDRGKQNRRKAATSPVLGEKIF